ncbi:flagellar protein FlaG [Paenibacillus alginolyticus]|uniref:Flagellar protein FlaG n=1 Tax=Paenibacillus alginolyticus TaxID=59839 RepID=A0ABT4G876_9BACL|nr:flagellar protein FlaG [Paenibacillus alginolyticus]MCY9692376.1 flagellar protein FlaG [Paenibacillus alginolyticus]MEC0143651.1 flagellar protein FlaG [Paenibacillus alginolyticus]
MANEFTINSGSYSQGINVGSGSSQPVVNSSNKSEHSTSSNKDEPATIQTTSELKQAEIRGERVTAGDEIIIKAIEKANKALDGRYTSFEFSVHEKTKQISIKVIDKDTKEVIREIPPEKTLDMVARMWEMAGILVDEKR